MPSSDRSQKHGAQLSMIPVYLRSGDDSSSSTRRASLPNPPQKQSRESYTASRKSVIHYPSESSSREPDSRRPAFDPRFGEMASPNEPPPPNSGKRLQQRLSCKPDPRHILATLERLVQPGLNVHELLDIHQLLAIHEQDLVDIAEREDRVQGKRQVGESQAAIFGMPLREAAKYASTSALFNGNKLYLPLVVFDCVEELYRTGIYQQDLFRVLPNRHRLAELIYIFNSPNPHLNYRSKNRRNKVAEYNTTLLHLESTQDICALLNDFLCSMPEPILPTYLFRPIWDLGGVYNDTEDDLEVGGDASSFINESQRRADFFPSSKFHPEDPSEATRINVVQHLLCLLPSPNFSLLVYLLAFFSHVVMMRDVNGMEIQELSGLFGKCVFGGGSASSPSKDYELSRKARKPGQAMMCWFLKRWGPISNGLFDVVGVRAEQGRPPVIIGGRVKPKSPIDLNSRPSPSAWLSTKERNKDVEWSMTLLSPRAISSLTVMSPSSLHYLCSPKSYFGIAVETTEDQEILGGPGILRKNAQNDDPVPDMIKPSATLVEKRLTPMRTTSTVASINSTADIDERLLDVSFSPLFHDPHVFDTILSGDAASCPVTSNGVPEMPCEVVEDKISLTGVVDTGPELAQALSRIRDLERQLRRNDTMLGAALEIMFRAKRRVDEIDDRLKELEVTLRVNGTSSLPQSGRLGLDLCLKCGDDTAVNLWREPHDKVVELRSLMLREL